MVTLRGKKKLPRRPILPVGKFACKRCGYVAFNVASHSQFEPRITLTCTRCLRKIELES